MAHLPVSASIKDEAGRMVFANKFLQDLFGWEDWKGKSMTELLSATVARRVTEEDRMALLEGLLVVQETVTTFTLRNGHPWARSYFLEKQFPPAVLLRTCKLPG